MIACHVCHGSDMVLFSAKNGHQIFRCRTCSLMFVHPIPSTSGIYEEDYFSGAEGGFGYVNYDADKEPMIPTFKKYLQLIRDALKGTGTLLDVGAATGFFVRLAQDAGVSARGVEISDHAASLGRSRGLAIETGTLAQVHGTFDCITMLDVIEHVPEPRAEIKLACALLRAGGVLVINTPDAGSLFARAMGKRWHLIVPPEHLYYFNRRNLTQLLKEEGFEVELETTIGKSFTFTYIWKTLYKWTKLWVFDVLSGFFAVPLLSRLAIPINLRDNMFVLARKR